MADDEVEILLVEDDANDELLTLRAFRRQNISKRVHVVRDGAEALEFIFCTGPYVERTFVNLKIILLDIRIPTVDGVAVLRQIRSDPRTKLIPVIVLSGSKDERELMELYGLGINVFINKPMTIEQCDEVARNVGHYCREQSEPLAAIDLSSPATISEPVNAAP